MKHPKLGQHFLNDTEIINLIIDQAKLLKSKNIIEIGPGAGALTSKLIDISKEYIGIELESEYIKLSKKRLDEIKKI